jgi:hypothetical protein
LPVKSVAELDTEAEGTRAQAGTSTRLTPSRTDVEDDSPTAESLGARARGVEGRVVALTEGIAVARRCRPSGRTILALRRLSGSLSAVCDALHEAVDAAASSSFGPSAARYLDCSLWWMTQLVGALESAVARQNETEQRTAASAAADFAGLYALGHLDALRARASAECTGGRVITSLHEEVMWLSSSLNGELDTD